MKKVPILLAAGFVVILFLAVMAMVGTDDAGTGKSATAPSTQMDSGANGGVGVNKDALKSENSGAGAGDQDAMRPGMRDSAPKDADGLRSRTTDETPGRAPSTGIGNQPSGSVGGQPSDSATGGRM